MYCYIYLVSLLKYVITVLHKARKAMFPEVKWYKSLSWVVYKLGYLNILHIINFTLSSLLPKVIRMGIVQQASGKAFRFCCCIIYWVDLYLEIKFLNQPYVILKNKQVIALVLVFTIRPPAFRKVKVEKYTQRCIKQRTSHNNSKQLNDFLYYVNSIFLLLNMY